MFSVCYCLPLFCLWFRAGVAKAIARKCYGLSRLAASLLASLYVFFFPLVSLALCLFLVPGVLLVAFAAIP